MTYSLVIIPEAQKDIQNAFSYYYDINPLLARGFIHSLEISYDKIQDQPHNYSYFGPSLELRSIALYKFPYSLVYKIVAYNVYISALHK
jgi:plasmid stabilization system protein ParE